MVICRVICACHDRLDPHIFYECILMSLVYIHLSVLFTHINPLKILDHSVTWIDGPQFPCAYHRN
jgi:hypothetical protein